MSRLSFTNSRQRVMFESSPMGLANERRRLGGDTGRERKKGRKKGKKKEERVTGSIAHSKRESICNGCNEITNEVCKERNTSHVEDVLRKLY